MFPTLNAIQNQRNGNLDAYAACFKQLDEQKWATFYGGTEAPPTDAEFAGDVGNAIKWNPQNQRVYFVGKTSAADFPLEQTTGYFNDQTKGAVDEWASRGFIVKLVAETGFRDWATFFGDEEKEYDAVTALLVRANGNIVVGGHAYEVGSNQTGFPFFPSSTPSLSPHIQTHGGVYIAEFNTSNAQVWATKLTNEGAFGAPPMALADIAENSGGRLFVVGNCNKDDDTDFIPIGNGSRAYIGFGSEVFIFDFLQEREILWSSYLGGNSNEYANSIVCLPGGGAIVTGTTLSNNFPAVALGGPGDTLLNDLTLDGFSDIFVSEFNDVEFGAKELIWSRYLGGPGDDEQPKISTDLGSSAGNATVVIGTNEFALTGSVSNDFSPLKGVSCPYYYGKINRGGSQNGFDACLVLIKNREVTFSTYWGGENPSAGGTGTETGYTISKGINPNGKAFVLLGGTTTSGKLAGQGETIPVCRELPFPDSYYHDNFFDAQLDAFISKIYYGDCLTSNITSPWGQAQTLEIQPNPAWNAISITFPERGKSDVSVLFFDAIGKVVTSISSMSFSASDPAVSIEIGHLSSGLYFITLQSSGRTYSGKFVKL